MNTTFLMTGFALLLVATTLMSIFSISGSVRPYSADAFMNYAATAANVNADPIGSFDGMKLQASPESYWRKSSDVKPLPGFQPGPDNLFIFKDNECKPECCGASYSCGSGCVCTTPDQRKYINERGGNNTPPGETF
jgi:hypothetical protein